MMRMQTVDPRAADLGLLVGRVLLVLLFAISGWGKLTGFSGFAGQLGSMGVPVPLLAAALAVAFELGGAVLVVLGLFTRLAALGLVLFTAAATLLAHRYWTMPPEAAGTNYLMFWKNVSMAGGLLVLAVAGPGRLSIDGRRS